MSTNPSDALTGERPHEEALSPTASFSVPDRTAADRKIDARYVDEHESEMSIH
jgi:hypothetical protein